ncbi:MAG: ribose-phosphate diphosphokinase [Gammaproteobacteria bacterium]|jgi:ribose-phosphate pyrophosphokinase
MRDSGETSILLGFPDYREQARALANESGLDYADIDVHRFPDGESRVQLPVSLPGHVILFTSLDDPNRRLIELELAASTAIRLGAEKLTLVTPYLCYMRQDVAFHPGEAVSQRVVGALLARRFDTVITVDPHLHRTKRLADAVPARRAIALSAAPVIAAWLQSRNDNPLLIGPDEESRQWVSVIAAPGGFEFGVALKTRISDNDVRIELPERQYGGRHVVLVDDVASTGHTLAEAARQIADHGAASISVVVSHALFVGDALQRLSRAGVNEICSTDSVAHTSNRLRLATILSRALSENSNGGQA